MEWLILVHDGQCWWASVRVNDQYEPCDVPTKYNIVRMQTTGASPMNTSGINKFGWRCEVCHGVPQKSFPNLTYGCIVFEYRPVRHHSLFEGHSPWMPGTGAKPQVGSGQIRSSLGFDPKMGGHGSSSATKLRTNGQCCPLSSRWASTSAMPLERQQMNWR